MKFYIKQSFSLLLSGFLILSLSLLISCDSSRQPPKPLLPEDEPDRKPVIYLYPEKVTQVDVALDYDGEVWVTWPEWQPGQNGWKVEAHPGGLIKNLSTGRTYTSLFWEGRRKESYRIDWGKCWLVEGKNTGEFLRNILLQKGLTEKEANEFIVYWLPRMKENVYNQITFLDEEYKKHSRLKINPEPDSILRIFMVYRPLKEMIKLTKANEPEVKKFERKGFCVVEWGGTEIKKRN